ncbi:MAG: bifunctional DNA primase/polymerase [Myxococcales bacterium]|nr:bifunctional DNA primase/polymerase [Myxococcales bacterium]
MAYAARGWRVAPCEPRGKRPLVRWGSEATTDADTIRAWWGRWPDANIAVITGEIAPGRFLSVVDCDVSREHNGLDALVAMCEMRGSDTDLETWVALTGGGGRHFYFEGPDALTTGASRLAPGVDTRGGTTGERGRGYVIAPPSVHASGRLYTWDDVDVLEGAARPIARPPSWLVAELLSDDAKEQRTVGPRSKAPRRFAATVPDAWRELVAHVALEAREVPVRHEMYLAVAGTLCMRGVDPSAVPAIVQGIASATGNDDGDRANDGRTTVKRWCAGDPITGAPSLRRHWPAVAVSLERAIQHARQLSNPELCSLADAAQRVREAFRGTSTPGGDRSVLAVSTGGGKSRGALLFAAERCDDGRARRADGNVSMNTRTVVAVPTHELARDLYTGEAARELRARGVTLARFFSPASAVDSEGRPVCRFQRQARALANGGLSVSWELCRGRERNPCAHYDGCAARDGVEGDAGAHVYITVWDLLRRTAEEAGTTAMVVGDEPPSPFRTETLTRDDANELRAGLPMFEPRFAEALRPLAARLQEVFELEVVEPSDGNVSPLRVLPAELCAPLASFERTNERGEPVALSAPDVRWAEIARTRENAAHAAHVGAVSRVAWLLVRLARSIAGTAERAPRPDDWSVLATDDGALSFMGPNEAALAARDHTGVVVYLDAAPDLEALRRVNGRRTLAETTVAVRDAHPTARVHVQWKHGTRSKLLPNRNAPDVEEIARGLAAAVDVAREDARARSLFVATFAAVEGVILAARLETELRGRELLSSCRWIQRAAPSERPARLDALVAQAREHIAPVLARWPGTIDTAHYFGLRGLNRWTGFDAFVTLGDATRNMDGVEREAAHLGISADGRMDFEVRRELEQAHGRARCPSRRSPARLVHVGRSVPFGVGWDACDRRYELEARPGRSELDPAQVAALCATMSRREAAKALGVAEGSVRRALERLTKNASANPPRGDSLRGINRRTPSDDENTHSAAEKPRQSAQLPVSHGGTSPVTSVTGPGHTLPRSPIARMEAPSMSPEDFDFALLKLCKRLSKNRAEVASMLGIARETLSRYSSGKRPIPEALAAKVREMLAEAA